MQQNSPAAQSVNPIRQTTITQVPSPAPSPAKQPIATVGVVDDNETFRRAMVSVLISEGFTAESYSSVASFVESGALSRAQCLILDVAMPGIDGLAFQSCLRGTNYDIPIIFCSGTSDDETRQVALDSGAVCFLKKPVSSSQLLECVRAALAKARALETRSPSR